MLKNLLLSFFVVMMGCTICYEVLAKENISDVDSYRSDVAVCVASQDDKLNVFEQTKRIYQEINCLRDVYYKIADDFYGKNALVLKHNFDEYLRLLYDINGDVYFPDFIKNENVGQDFVLKTKMNVRDDVISMINRYIDGLAYWTDNFSLEELSEQKQLAK